MENNSQQPVGQPAAAPQAGQPAAESPKAANLNQAVEKAAESAKPAPQQEGQPEDWEWDGNPNNLPPQFAKYGKGIQRYFTKRSMSDAELRKAGEEHQKFLQSDEYKGFQTYKQSLGRVLPEASAPTQIVPEKPLVSQEEYEDALLDTTGKKFIELVERVADRKAKSVDEKVSKTVSQLQQATNVAQWNAALSDFSELHPEAVEYHSMGLMEPIVRQELASGRHNSYESVLNAALERVEKSVQAIREKEQAKAQGRIQEKKAAVVNTGTAVGDFSVVEVDKSEALDKAIEFGLQNKKVKVRSKR